MSTTAPRDHDSACAHVASLFRNPWLKEYVRGKLRIDPMYGDSSCRFKLTNAVERLGHVLRWHKGSTINFPTRETIARPFRRRGFTEDILPMWGGTPFNNYLFVFRRPNARSS
ncbi:MAG TPA: hypothetical protein VF205_04400 [Nitrospiraceae bacterium]